eukprot:786206-Prymnesium_polylepis.1
MAATSTGQNSGDSTPFDAGLITAMTSRPSVHVCASWCHWDWKNNCAAEQCIWCDICKRVLPPPMPPAFPPGRSQIADACLSSCTSSEQCAEARCSRCTFCEHGFHLAEAHDAPNCQPHTAYDSAHAMCSSFCDSTY